MELVVAGVAVWLLIAVCLGVLLGRSAREAEAQADEIAPAPVADPGGNDLRTAEDTHRRVV